MATDAKLAGIPFFKDLWIAEEILLYFTNGLHHLHFYLRLWLLQKVLRVMQVINSFLYGLRYFRRLQMQKWRIHSHGEKTLANIAACPSKDGTESKYTCFKSAISISSSNMPHVNSLLINSKICTRSFIIITPNL